MILRVYCQNWNIFAFLHLLVNPNINISKLNFSIARAMSRCLKASFLKSFTPKISLRLIETFWKYEGTDFFSGCFETFNFKVVIRQQNDCSFSGTTYNIVTYLQQWYIVNIKMKSKILGSTRERWGNAVMRGKEVFCHYSKTKNGQELLLCQQLHLTIKQIGTKNGQYGFSWFGDY